jgi:hypothetical protein
MLERFAPLAPRLRSSHSCRPGSGSNRSVDLCRRTVRPVDPVLDRVRGRARYIGAVSTRLGVAGGELIIPTLVLGFGLLIKAARTMSLLISIPTMAVGLSRHQASGAFQDIRELERIVLPMALGTVLGSTLGAGSLRPYPQAPSSCSSAACSSPRRYTSSGFALTSAPRVFSRHGASHAARRVACRGACAPTRCP